MSLEELTEAKYAQWKKIPNERSVEYEWICQRIFLEHIKNPQRRCLS